MKKLKKITLLIVALTFAALLIAVASAAPTATSGTGFNIDVGGLAAPAQVGLGTTCTVVWTSVTPPTGTFTILIIAPDGTTTTLADQPISQSGVISFVTNQVGWWTVEFIGVTNPVTHMDIYATPQVFVLPESAIGALAAFGAGLAAFGIFKLKRPKTNISLPL